MLIYVGLTCRINKDEDKDSLFPSVHRTGSFSIRLLLCNDFVPRKDVYVSCTASSVQRIRIPNNREKREDGKFHEEGLDLV